MPTLTGDWLQYGALGLAGIVIVLASVMVRWVMNASTIREQASTDREKYFFSQMEAQRSAFVETIDRQRESHATMLNECRERSDAQIATAYAKYDSLSSSFGRVAASLIDVADQLEALRATYPVQRSTHAKGD